MQTYYIINVKGVVQGVGFRPFIYREVVKRKANGYVKNTGSGVEIVIDDSKFVEILQKKPPLSIIESFDVQTIEHADIEGFKIIKSSKSGGISQIPPDIFLCKDCLREMNDKKNRRFKYYFTTCTNCGPRFSMIHDFPYDRPATSMDEFEMCDLCKKEYSDPLDRRYHAQTIACKDCGPKLYLIDKKSSETTINDNRTNDAIKKAAILLKKGKIIAIKGVGGFHLCSKATVRCAKELRKNKINRQDKPFAIMVKDIAMLRDIVKFNKVEKVILQSPRRPIVVLDKKDAASMKHISELNSIGVMLPYTALHYLIFDYIKEPLIMTSANISGNPLSIDDKDLGNIDYILSNDRKIINRCDDSVIKVIKTKIPENQLDHALFIRKSRGFTPVSFQSGKILEKGEYLALGSELKNVYSLYLNGKVFNSQYIGTTSKIESFNFYMESLEFFEKFTGIKPEIIACDMHPEFNTTRFAEQFSDEKGIPLKKIQHHHAHIASVAFENNLRDYIGISCDGTGYGADGAIWGGEIFDVIKNHFNRIGHLQEQIMPGENSIIINKKALIGILSSFLKAEDISRLGIFDEDEIKLHLNQIKENFNTFKTTSTGRVLDAASALLGICENNSYEGRAAMLLESSCGESKSYGLDPIISRNNSTYILETNPLFKFMIGKLWTNKKGKETRKRLAATVFDYLAKGFFKIAQRYNLEKYNGRKKIVFSGGVAYNSIISAYMLKKRVLLNKIVPPGDGGISFGQIGILNAK